MRGVVTIALCAAFGAPASAQIFEDHPTPRKAICVIEKAVGVLYSKD
jgi:hypothetical protein